LDLFISELTQGFSVEEFYREGQRRHLAVSPINTAETVTRDAHLAAREFFIEPEDCAAGDNLTYPGAPYKLEKTPWRLRRSAPTLGQHNAEIYCDELGLSLDELLDYQNMGVI
jgi:crotonobetainyl-CoA:carnitine CoA-transferase CaiB-like acyl-CoA transferase